MDSARLRRGLAIHRLDNFGVEREGRIPGRRRNDIAKLDAPIPSTRKFALLN
jgi:hypothetical protein